MIRLRDVLDSDSAQLLTWRNLPEVAKYMYTPHRISEEEHVAWFGRMRQDESSRYWVIVCDEADVGLANVTNLDTNHQRCSWAFYLASPLARGKGVGSFVEYSVLRYVFDELGLNKLCCEVLTFNEAVIGMHTRFGFQPEGIYRQHIKKGDEYFDVQAMAMLRAEWQQHRPGIEERLRAKGLIP